MCSSCDFVSEWANGWRCSNETPRALSVAHSMSVEFSTQMFILSNIWQIKDENVSNHNQIAYSIAVIGNENIFKRVWLKRIILCILFSFSNCFFEYFPLFHVQINNLYQFHTWYDHLMFRSLWYLSVWCAKAILLKMRILISCYIVPFAIHLLYKINIQLSQNWVWVLSVWSEWIKWIKVYQACRTTASSRWYYI